MAGTGRVRVGTDLTRIADVQASIEQFGGRYLERLFTDHERACCPGPPALAAPGLAARFAAKEATLQVLRPVGDPPGWREIEVRRVDGGATDLHLSGRAAELAAGAGITDLALSLTHEADLAMAVVVADRTMHEERA
jgi:holo-[acyl-carrier protein] synthase